MDGYQIYNTSILQSLLYSWQIQNGDIYYKQSDTGYYNLDDSTVWFYKVSEYTARKKYMDTVINGNVVYNNVYLYNIREFVINKSSVIDSPWQTQNDYYLITNASDAIVSEYIFSRDVINGLGVSLKILNSGINGGKPGTSLANEQKTEAVIYPNPNGQQKLIVDLYHVKENEEMTITITDMAGKLYKKEMIRTPSGGFVSKIITIGSLPAGIYMVHFASASFNKTEKLSIL